MKRQPENSAAKSVPEDVDVDAATNESRLSDAALRDPRMVSWSIPKAEWDGYLATTAGANTNLPFVFASGVLVLLFIGSLALFYVAAPTQPALLMLMLGMSALICAPGFAALLFMRHRVLLWRKRGPSVWESQACVCPLCLMPLHEHADDANSCGHGFVVEDQPWVMRYYEALAAAPEALTRQNMQGESEWRALRNRAEQRGTRPRGFFRRCARTIRMVWDRWLGFDQPMWKRVVAHCVLAFFVVAVLAPFSWIGACTSLWVGGFTFMGYRAVRSANHARNRLRCAKCDHTLLSADVTQACPECGASLAAPGSVKSAEARLFVARWLMGVIFIFLGYYFPLFIAPSVGRALPNNLLFAAAEHVPTIGRDAFDLLAARPLTAKEQQRLADLMLREIRLWARGNGDNQFRAAQYIAGSVANGTLPQEYAELLAHAVCQLDVEIDGASTAPGTSFTREVRDTTSTSRELREVIEIDAVRAAKGIRVRMHFVGIGKATSPSLGPTVGILAALELDGAAIWSATATTPPTLVSDAIATIDLAMPGVSPPLGDHQLVVRAYVAITADFAAISSFDETGAPMLPAPPAGTPSLGPWMIERAYTLRVR